VVRQTCVRAVAGGLLALALAATSRLDAAGFALYEQGQKGNALGGAFAAQADDPSAMFYNPAGNAWNEKLTMEGGAFLVFRPSAHMDGQNPYPGTDYSTNMAKDTYWLGHGYAVLPIRPGSINLAAGFWTPFGLGGPWSNPNAFAGRFLSQRADIRVLAASVQISAKLADWIAIGAGPEFRFSDVKLGRNVSVFNPFTDRFVDVAHLSLMSEGFPTKVTWNAGLLIKPCDRCRIGVAYHGRVDFDYKGTANFGQISTGNPQLDGLVASRLPVGKGVPGSTTIQYPGVLLFGVSYDVTPKLTINADGNYTSWSSFDQTVLKITGLPDTTLPHDWKNTWTIRAGAGYNASDNLWLGAGFIYDQTPQPDEDVGALLPDANRTGITVGAGFKMAKSFELQFSSLFLWFHQRTTLTNHDNFNGTYKTFAILPGVSFKSTF
jgi:long-chain fatty acid transport protein